MYRQAETRNCRLLELFFSLKKKTRASTLTGVVTQHALGSPNPAVLNNRRPAWSSLTSSGDGFYPLTKISGFEFCCVPIDAAAKLYDDTRRSLMWSQPVSVVVYPRTAEPVQPGQRQHSSSPQKEKKNPHVGSGRRSHVAHGAASRSEKKIEGCWCERTRRTIDRATRIQLAVWHGAGVTEDIGLGQAIDPGDTARHTAAAQASPASSVGCTPPPHTRALFSSENWKVFRTVALSFVCGKYCPIID